MGAWHDLPQRAALRVLELALARVPKAADRRVGIGEGEQGMGMAAKRKAISKKARFEVFKRDGFTCQYCGGKAPDVILHVDHIDPVSKGGGNDILNLITACAGCNGGKGATRLDDASALAKQRQQLEELSARREQLKMMLEGRWG